MLIYRTFLDADFPVRFLFTRGYKSLDLGAGGSTLFGPGCGKTPGCPGALAARGCHGVPVLMGDEPSTLACTVDFFLKAQHWIVICCDISKYVFIFVILTSIYIYISIYK
jgi:hypothetical protein